MGVDAPRPGLSTEMSRMPVCSNTAEPKPNHRLVAAPGQSNTGLPVRGPHSLQPNTRPSGSPVVPCRSGFCISVVVMARRVVTWDGT
ncbi:hypothetical protein MVI01_10830 [Myxococcus virescens]|uniref:Uncharacterized protein n=1 Tax=Myxococcus virescens TaxID=83456 RepID=A0A511H994_9BACT|nr:hypothetical protein MVI01_10830 [Myxococcus virescens]